MAGVACNTPEKKAASELPKNMGDLKIHRYGDEQAYEKAVDLKGDFFNKHELSTIAILCDIIVPKDDISGSATDAKVPDFIEFTVKDQPQLQTPLRGGLRWLDAQCLKRFGKSFASCGEQQRLELVDVIAYPEKAKNNREMAQGVAFFSTMRNLTLTGFYTSEIGVKDMGYDGNKPNQWNGVPDDVLKQYGLTYTERELNESVKFES